MAATLSVLRRRNVPLAPLFEELSFTEGEVSLARGRVDWDDFALFLDRAEAALDDPRARTAAIEEAISAQRPLQVLASLVLGSQELYELGLMISRSLYRVWGARLDRLPDGRLRLEMVLPKERRGSTVFTRNAAVGWRIFPRLIGLHDAGVEAEVSTHRGVYLIDPHEPAPARTRTLDALREPLADLLEQRGQGPGVTPMEILDALEVGFSEQPYRELAAEVGQRLMRHRDLAALERDLAVALEVHLCSRAVALRTRRRDGSVAAEPRSGPLGEGAGALRVLTLAVAGREVGRLEVETPEPMPESIRLLLEAMTPWIAAAVDGCLKPRTPLPRSASLSALPPYLVPIARLLSSGLSEKDVAAQLDLSGATVRTYVTRLYNRLGVRNRAELVATVLSTPRRLDA